MNKYYEESLNSSSLFEVYQTRIERVKQYLDKEIEFVKDQLSPNDIVLELGAGYGRIMKELAPKVKSVYGIDISESSVIFGRQYLKDCPNCELSLADAYKYNTDMQFDTVVCLQNGLSAFKGDDVKLVNLAMKMVKAGGKAFFSSYSESFWETRLAWFEEQADKGLLGEIDYEKTKDGKIICKDGFSASTFTESDFERLGKLSGCDYYIQEVDNSSLFMVIRKVGI